MSSTPGLQWILLHADTLKGPEGIVRLPIRSAGTKIQITITRVGKGVCVVGSDKKARKEEDYLIRRFSLTEGSSLFNIRGVLFVGTGVGNGARCR